MGKNVTIPSELFYRIIDLLEDWDIYEYSRPTQEQYCDVMHALATKKQSLELREAYARIVYADNEDERHEARIRYLRDKLPAGEPF
jgi:hypothetical protein